MNELETTGDNEGEDFDDGEDEGEEEEDDATEERASGAANENSRAYRLRQKKAMGGPLKPADVEFLKGYDRDNPPAAIGARASRKVSYTEEEHAAVGTGDAAKAAVESFGLAAMTREEGRRLDTIVGQGMNALVRACELHEKMAAVLLRERMQDSAQNRALMESVRVHFLARTEAEADLQSQRAEAPKDQLSEIVAALLPALVSQLASKPEKPPGKG